MEPSLFSLFSTSTYYYYSIVTLIKPLLIADKTGASRPPGKSSAVSSGNSLSLIARTMLRVSAEDFPGLFDGGGFGREKRFTRPKAQVQVLTNPFFMFHPSENLGASHTP